MRRTLVVVLAAVSLQAAATASINKQPKPDSNTPDARALYGLMWEADEARKIELLEYFDTQFPHSEWRISAYAMLQDLYARRNQPAKAIAAGDRILALDPDALEAARKNQDVAASRGDGETTRKYAAMSYAIALRLARATGDAGTETHDRLELAKTVVAEHEYDIYGQAIREPDLHKRIAILDQLVLDNPRTQYLENANLAYFAAYRQLNDNGKALEAAERLNAGGQFYPDVLIFEAEYYFRSQKNPQRVVGDCQRLRKEIAAGRQPADFDAAEWPKKKDLFSKQALLIEFYSYKQRNEPANAAAAADAILSQPGAPPDIVLYAADYYFRVERNVKKVRDYSELLLRTIGEDKKPAGITDADWMRQKDIYTEVACYMIGSLQMQAGNYTVAEQTLRQAWEIAKRTDYLLPAITAVLAATDQHLEKYAEAAHLYKQSMDFGPAYRAEALKKLAALKSEHGVQ